MNSGGGDRAARGAGIVLGIGVGLAATAVLVVAGLLFLDAHPLGDDFCHARDAARLGVFGCVQDYYLSLGGRWPAWTISCSLFSVAGLWAWYRVALFVISWGLVAALAFLLCSLLPLQGRGRLVAAMVGLLYVLYWTGMPHPGQTIYWLEGGIQYTMALSLCMVLIACLVRLPDAPSRQRRVSVGALAVLALVTAAFHELIAAVFFGVLVTGSALAFLWRDGRRHAWLVVLMAALVGFATGYLAPGNEARAAMTTTVVEGRRIERGLLAGLGMWIQALDTPAARDPVDFAGTPLGWILDPKLLGASLLFATAGSIRSLRPGWLEKPAGRLFSWRRVIPTVWLGLLTAAFLAGGWAQGRMLPFRALNGLYLVFLLGWFSTLFVYTRWDHSDDAPPVRLARGAGAVVFALGLLVSANFKLGLRDLVDGRTSSFDRQMEQRYAKIEQARARGQQDLVLAPIDPWPGSYFEALDVSPDPTRFKNQCLRRYAGVRSLGLAEPAE